MKNSSKLVRTSKTRAYESLTEKKLRSNADKIILVGSPNVGKSVIFNALTGVYVTVSNYPGTTVETTRGKGEIDGVRYDVLDTPGMYSLLPISEEERVSRSILLEEDPSVVLHVVDAKNLKRMLPFTFQLIEAGLPVILVLNFMDEARELGIKIDLEKLEEMLDIPVIDTVATEGENIQKLKIAIKDYVFTDKANRVVSYDDDLNESIEEIESLLKFEYKLSKRMISTLLLLGDEELREVVGKKEKESYENIKEIIAKTKARNSVLLNYTLTLKRQEASNEISNKVVSKSDRSKKGLKEMLDLLTLNPIIGIPLFIFVIYAMYEFVGVFGAQTVVDFLEGTLFEKFLTPFTNKIFEAIIPWPVLQDLFVHEYGIITLGIRYTFALILPIVATFFIAFSIIEDSGYLPRLAMLIDTVFKKIGLNGRAVIPIVLGFGCDTMATMVTRTLETKRERVISSILLALAIPCSAQLGVILALLAGNAKALWIWVTVMTFIFLFIGYLASKVMPGEKPMFYMEISPLRIPKISNVLTKTYTRVEWYFKEIFPLFIYASIFIWVGKVTRLFDLFIKILEYPMEWIGLPSQAAQVFLFGFFRRDFGAGGLYDLQKSGMISGIQLLVAVVALTLFVPCIAQFSMNVKERGLKTALLMAGFIFPFAFLVSGLVNVVLVSMGVTL